MIVEFLKTLKETSALKTCFDVWCWVVEGKKCYKVTSKMRMLRWMIGVTRKNKIRNEPLWEVRSGNN